MFDQGGCLILSKYLLPPIQSHPHRCVFRQHQLRDAVSEGADVFERNVGEALFDHVDLLEDLFQGFDHVTVVVQVVAVVALAELGRKVGSPGRKERYLKMCGSSYSPEPRCSRDEGWSRN